MEDIHPSVQDALAISLMHTTLNHPPQDKRRTVLMSQSTGAVLGKHKRFCRESRHTTMPTRDVQLSSLCSSACLNPLNSAR